MRKVKILSMVLVFLMMVSLLVPAVSVSAEADENIEASVSTYNLIALMNKGDKLLADHDFTEESLASYKLAYDKALGVLFYGTTQEEIDGVTAELESAINALSAQIETTTAPEPVYRRAGDVNEDTRVNIKDATAIQKHLANIAMLSSIGVALADANGDGNLNIKDATEVQKFLAGLTVSNVIGEEVEVLPEYTEATKPIKTEATMLNTDNTEKTKTTTEATLPTTAPVITTEPTEVLSTNATEVTKVTEITTPEVTDALKENEENVADGDIGFTLAEEFRVEYYGSEKTELYLVKSRDEMASVIAKIQSSGYSSLYTTPVISEKYNDKFFEDNALIISLNCVGGSNCYQTIDSLNLDGDTLTVCRTLYKPDIVLTDMNYRYALLEVNANAVKDVKTLADSVTYATIGEDITIPDYHEGETAIYFTNTQNWTKIYIHFWGGAYDTNWPGAEMEFVENNIYGQDVYKAYIPVDTTGIVFSAGVNMPQTIDIATDISDGYGFYPTETIDGKWKVESYIYENKESDSISTTTPDTSKPATKPTMPVIIPDPTLPDEDAGKKNGISFNVAEQCRVEYYSSCETELYLIRSAAEFEAVLSKIEGGTDGYLYKKPVRDEKYNDEYFMSDSLIVSMNVVGGSCCTQTIDGVSVDGNTLTVHRTLYKPQNVLCDMNYQYVLIEVSNADINGVTTVENHNTYITVE